MKSSGLVVITSIIIAFVLTIGGGYISIDNLIHPQGNLFEGIITFSLGVIVFLLLAMASTLGRTIQAFTEIYTHQLEMQKTMQEFYARAAKSRPKSIGDILGGLGNSMTITNLDTGETTSTPISDDPIKNFQDIIKNSLFAATGKSEPIDPKDMNREQLEQELAKAVKKDDYEKANEIKELLQNLNDGNEEN